MIASTSPIVRMSVVVATPFALVMAVFTLLGGHNRPGGGFAAGLLLGAIVMVRAIARLPRPTQAIPLLAAGGLIAGATALAPLVWGDVLLDQVVIDTDVPILGTLKTGTALVFDLGVVAIVVGLVIAVLDGFGVGSDAGPLAEPHAGSRAGSRAGIVPAPEEPR